MSSFSFSLCPPVAVAAAAEAKTSENYISLFSLPLMQQSAGERERVRECLAVVKKEKARPDQEGGGFPSVCSESETDEKRKLPFLCSSSDPPPRNVASFLLSRINKPRQQDRVACCTRPCIHNSHTLVNASRRSSCFLFSEHRLFNKPLNWQYYYYYFCKTNKETKKT